MATIPDGIIRMEEGLNPADYVVATYLLQGEPGEDTLERAVSMAVEQTVGRGIFSQPEFLPLLETLGARLISWLPIPDDECRVSLEGRPWQQVLVRIAYPVENTAFQIPMLLNNMMSDVSMNGMLKLVDLSLPSRFVDAFQGPKFGAEGIRALSGTTEAPRPLTCTILKPCVGLTAKQAGQMFLEHALGGADFVKDDENMAYSNELKIEDRVRACAEAEKQAFEQTGEHTTYLVNITDNPDKILAKARRVIEAGATGLMLTPLTTGLPVLQMLAEAPELNVPLFVHPSNLGAHSWSPDFGISEHILWSKLIRLAGADLVSIPTPYGKFTHRRDKFVQLCKLNASPMRHIKAMFSQTGGGVNPINAYAAAQDIGNEIMLVAGGAIQEHPMGARAGMRALRQSLEAYAAGIPLEQAAREHPELGKAYEKWGPKP